ncbi:MAG TPA: hypothetical protein VMB22_03985 [Verrucomicrobiae bacterium]|nr:hypothetical protein [Verrucomicrobiae bacterium]
MLAVTLANAWIVSAQTTNVPGPTDYSAFSRFIATRNIFDPSRYPRTATTRPARYQEFHVSRSAPSFTLVGTMSYQKGMFAFFDGNQSDLRRVLQSSGSIAGYTVAGITLTNVTLQSADKKQTVQLQVGDSMRQDDNNNWQLAGSGGDASSGFSSGAGATDTGASAVDSADTPPASSAEQGDILKKLMQEREQQLK